MATKTENRVLLECRQKLSDQYAAELLKAGLIGKIGVVNWAVMQSNPGGCDPIRHGLFARAWCLAAGGTESQADEAERRADSRYLRARNRRVGEVARRGGNCYKVSGRRGSRVAVRIGSSAVFSPGSYTLYISGFNVPRTRECIAPRKYRVNKSGVRR